MRTHTTSRLASIGALLALLALTGCVAYPAGYGYGEGGYYAAPAPTVVVPIVPWYGGWGYGGWGHGGGGHGGWR